MKIKLKTGGDANAHGNDATPASAAPAGTPTAELPPTPSGGVPRLKFKNSFSGPSTEKNLATPSESGKKPRKSYAGKKGKADGADGDTPAKGRKRKADAGDDTTPAKRPKGRPPVRPKIDTTVGKGPLSGSGGGTIIKFSARPVQTPRIKMKHVGALPTRPIGVGYDSEDSEAEQDPTIESQFILRMRPGEDCEYLRTAINEKKIGMKPGEGGADVSMVFFDKEARRGMVTIQGRHYAAAMVDLPCVIEATKSWDKKSWMKSADICQMLLVIGQVKNEEEAKSVPLPAEIDQRTFQYPHGLTPPMHWVRKRRFRKRVSHREIESIEDEVSRLMALDKKVKDSGGNTEIEIIDLAKMRQESEQAEEDEEEEEEEEEDQYYEEGDEVEMPDYFGEADEAEADVDALEAMMEAEFEMGNDEDGETANAAPSIETAAQHALQTANGSTAAAETPSASGADTTDADADDDGDDDDDDGEEMDEDELAAQEEIQQQREELKTLEQDLQAAKAGLEAQTNPLLKQRAKAKVQSLQSDLDLKKATLGIE